MATSVHPGDRDAPRGALGRPLRRPPIATIALLVITAIVTGLQFVDPRVLGALRRQPEALAAGEWWRLITPLFVHADGWSQIIANFLGIALVGLEVERLFGSRWWLALYIAGGLVGEIAGYAWEPTGAGASVALCGLIGGLLTALLWRRAVWPIAVLVALCLIAGLIGADFGGGASVALAVLTGLLVSVPFRLGRWQRGAPLMGAVGLLGALALAGLLNIHGPPIIVGACLTALMLWRGQAREGEARPRRLTA